jgi:hypothetical protein
MRASADISSVYTLDVHWMLTANILSWKGFHGFPTHCGIVDRKTPGWLHRNRGQTGPKCRLVIGRSHSRWVKSIPSRRAKRAAAE